MVNGDLFTRPILLVSLTKVAIHHCPESNHFVWKEKLPLQYIKITDLECWFSGDT